MTRVESADALARLLDELAWLQDTYCLEMSAPPGAAVAPERVELVLRDEGTGGFDPGDVRVHAQSRLTALGIREWSFLGEHFDHAPDHCMAGADLIEDTDRFGLAFDVPSPVRLVATAFEHERLPDHHAVVPPWTSTSWLQVTAPRAQVPSPAEWVEAFDAEGAEVTWRLYGGPAHPTENVSADYTGWFLERPSRVDEHLSGLFMFTVGSGHVYVDRKDVDDDLWWVFCRAAARLFPTGEFESGNLRFTAEEWLARLSSEGHGAQ
ncbi:hypothetical protein SAMN04489835_5424 [Mycolicibacterium rutilum]|uniref:Uncharacterized protein n=1 Tax=Mycolicibacterium rutilum TaxID=370526 RepID=A0A1H6LMS6_MYCRU|nr:hypothetical protein [Mycolicibacterium rutilum]SEH89893.1 hypothetical protein SAMN04489835_5424 [Mycolicibacterium rutilum]